MVKEENSTFKGKIKSLKKKVINYNDEVDDND